MPVKARRNGPAAELISMEAAQWEEGGALSGSNPGTCPAAGTERLSSARPEFMRDIFETYAWARAEAPVAYVGSMDLWVVTGQEEVMAILRDDRRFSTRRNFDSDFDLTPECEELLRGSDYSTPALLAMDPPEHTRVRDVVMERFSPRRLGELEPLVRRVATELADGLTGDTADLVAEFAYALPMRIVCELIGLPHGDHAAVKGWHNQWMALLVVPLDPAAQLDCARTMVIYDAYLRGLIATRAAQPRADLASDLAAAVDAGTCTTSQAVAALRFLLAAGHETVMNTLTNALFQLLSRPDRWAALARNPELAAAAAEEGLRHDSGAQGTTRHALVDVEVGGVTIPAGARVHVMTGAPGRDPATVADPDTFDLARPDTRKHLAFGYGTHFCAGAPLARLELEIALRTLATRFPGMRLADGFDPVYPPGGYMLRGPATLPVVLR